MNGHSAVEKTLHVALERGEIGVQVAAYLNGRPVVWACAGVLAPDSDQPVDDRTLF